MADSAVKCPKCQTPVPADSKFCANCGASVSSPGPDTGPLQAGDELFHLLAQSTLGEYEIKGELGRGGMGAVFLAHEIALDRKVAIKVLPPELTYGTGIIERFKREARTAAKLNHPNIIPIFRVAEAGNLLFFVMKFVEGRGLDGIIDETGKLPIPMIHAVLTQVGGALGYAHRRGVIHRDVKPANIMIDEEGWAVVTDFGIAKATSAQGITATGAAIGTPYYMSPEQCSGKGVTGLSDQYSLGVVAHQMLTGSVPFTGDSIMEIMKQHFMDEPPDLATLRPDCPPQLLQAVRRAMSKDAGGRFPSLEDFVQALGQTPDAHDGAVRTQMIEMAKSGSSPVLRMPATPLSPVPLGRPRPGAARPLGARRSATAPVPVPAARRRRALLVGAAVSVIAVAGGVGGWLALRSGQGAVAVPSDSLVAAVPVGADSAGSGAGQPATGAPSDTAASPAVSAPLAPDSAYGTLLLRNVPNGATVLVDGRRVTPPRVRVRPGPHVVEIAASGFEPYSSPVTIARGAQQTLTPDLRLRSEVAPATVQAVPTGGREQPVGPAGAPTGRPSAAPTGAQAPPTTPANQQPTVQPSQPAASPDEPGSLTAGARPLGSATLNGAPIARWPAVNLPLLPATYRLTIQAPGFEDSTIVFLVRPGQRINLRTIALRTREGGP